MHVSMQRNRTAADGPAFVSAPLPRTATLGAGEVVCGNTLQELRALRRAQNVGAALCRRQWARVLLSLRCAAMHCWHRTRTAAEVPGLTVQRTRSQTEACLLLSTGRCSGFWVLRVPDHSQPDPRLCSPPGPQRGETARQTAGAHRSSTRRGCRQCICPAERACRAVLDLGFGGRDLWLCLLVPVSAARSPSGWLLAVVVAEQKSCDSRQAAGCACALQQAPAGLCLVSRQRVVLSEVIFAGHSISSLL